MEWFGAVRKNPAFLPAVGDQTLAQNLSLPIRISNRTNCLNETTNSGYHHDTINVSSHVLECLIAILDGIGIEFNDVKERDKVLFLSFKKRNEH